MQFNVFIQFNFSLRKKIPCHLTNQRFKISFIQLLLSVNSEKFIFHFELLVKNCQIFNLLITMIRQQRIPVHGGNQAIREKVNSSSPKGAAACGKYILTSLLMRVPLDSHSAVLLLPLQQKL